MSAQDAERAAALERRYRRLLRCYPPGHRQVHREEMLGVLLATARPGQRAPGARQTVNLVACGLAIRVRRALSSLADESWQDALAVVSLITPVLMLIISALDLAVAARQVVAVDLAYPLAGAFWHLGLVIRLGAPAAVMTGWLTAVLLALTGRRRAAAGPGDRREVAGLPHDRSPFRRVRLHCGRLPGETLRVIDRFWLHPPGRPGARSRCRRHARTRHRGLAGLGAGGRACVPARRRQHPLRGQFDGYRCALARQPAVRRARVAGGDRVLAGAGQAVIPRLTCLSRPVPPR